MAFELYTNSKDSTNALKEIAGLKNNMNRLRLDYTKLKDKVINITPYWLLGFIIFFKKKIYFSSKKWNEKVVLVLINVTIID